MFGWPSCFVNGNLFAGLYKQSMIFRLSENDQVAFLKLDRAGEFEPILRRNRGLVRGRENRLVFRVELVRDRA